MGFELAKKCAESGASVILISGPTVYNTDHQNIKQINILSADEMYNECMKYFHEMDITIMAAAIADFTPKHKSLIKIKKNNNSPIIELIPTKDVLYNLGKIKTQNQILVGFALETNDEIENAKSKLKKKNLDFIVLNSLNDKGAGFGGSTNKVTFIDRDDTLKEYKLKPKTEVADDIIEHIIEIQKLKIK